MSLTPDPYSAFDRQRWVAEDPAHKRAELGIRIVQERARCFPQLSVYENLLMGGFSRQEARDEVRDLVDEVLTGWQA